MVKASVLTVTDVGCLWVAIPGGGLYMKSFMRDRKVILTMIKKYTYKEILQTIGYISTTLIPFVPFTVLAFVAKRKLIYANR